jgi:hypothetical protein
MQEPSLQAGRSVAERSSELVRSLAPRYEKVLQEAYKPVGTSRDFTRTYAFPSGPASEFKQRLIVQAAGLRRDFQCPYAGTLSGPWA